MRLQIFHDTVVALSSINNGFFSPFPGTKTLIVIMISVRRIRCVMMLEDAEYACRASWEGVGWEFVRTREGMTGGRFLKDSNAAEL